MKMTRKNADRARATASMSRDIASISESAQTCSDEHNDVDITVLISFFKLLDRWDREAERNAKSVQ
jgi:hypothetical protein